MAPVRSGGDGRPAHRTRAVLILHLVAWVVMLTMSASTVRSASLQALQFSQIPGWSDDDHAAALGTFARSCARMVKSKRGVKALGRKVAAKTVVSVCRRALALNGSGETPDRTAARLFFEQNFAPYRVTDGADNGLFTGYFEPQYAGSRTRTITYHVPLYRKPADFKQPYLNRRQIEQGALDGRDLELVFLASMVDAFFLHVQGSARIALPDGSVMRVGFAAKSGHPYTPIGRVLVKRGALRLEDVTMQTIRAWLEQNPAEAQEVMWRNESFIFFRQAPSFDPELGPMGAQSVNLDALRSIAVDKSLYSYGLPMWLDTTLPLNDDGATEAFRRLMVAQDTGSAIKGAIRADVFTGSGDEAGEIAGRMKQNGGLVVLLPQPGGPAPAENEKRAAEPEEGGLK